MNWQRWRRWEHRTMVLRGALLAVSAAIGETLSSLLAGDLTISPQLFAALLVQLGIAVTALLGGALVTDVRKTGTGAAGARSGSPAGNPRAGDGKAAEGDGEPLPELWLPPGMRRAPAGDAAPPPTAAGRPPRRRLSRFHITAGLCSGIVVASLVAIKPSPPFPCPSPVRLRMVASTEKAEILAGIARRYGERQPLWRGRCRTVSVTVKGIASGASATAIAAGWRGVDGIGPDGPDIWSPASSAWLDQVLARGDQPGLKLDTLGLVATTPLVLAIPARLAQNFPARRFSWERLASVPSSGLPIVETGDGTETFTVGRTNPELSTSGLHATIALYQAALGELSPRVLTDPANASMLHGVEQSLTYGGETTLGMLCKLREDAAGGPSAVPVEEKSVIDYNLGRSPGTGTEPACSGSRPDEPLVAVYPDEPTYLSDNPFVFVERAPWLTQEQVEQTGRRRQAARRFLDYLHGEGRKDLLDAGFRTPEGSPGQGQTPLTVDNGVQPSWRPDGNAGAARLDGPTLLSLGEAWRRARKPTSVLLVVDVSLSMGTTDGRGRTNLAAAVEAADRSLDRVGGQDRIGLWAAATALDGKADRRELVPIGPAGEPVGGLARKELIRWRLAGLQHTNRGTGLYDTVHASVLALRRDQAARGGAGTGGTGDGAGGTGAVSPEDLPQQVVILLTDGQDDNDRRRDTGRAELEQVLRSANLDGRGIRVFVVAYGGIGCAGDDIGMIVRASGGDCHDAGAIGFDAAFTAVAAKLWGAPGGA